MGFGREGLLKLRVVDVVIKGGEGSPLEQWWQTLLRERGLIVDVVIEGREEVL